MYIEGWKTNMHRQMTNRAKPAFALPVVLVATIVFAIIGISAMGLFLNRGERLKTTYAQKQAHMAALGAFNFAVGKLLAAPLVSRWFADDTSAHLVLEVDGSLLDVFLCDVFNNSGQLTHVHVIARCQRAIDMGFKQASALVFGTVQVSGNDELTATVLARQLLEPKAVNAFVRVNEGLFTAAGNPYAKNRRVSISGGAYESGIDSLQANLAADAIADIDFSDSQTMRSFVALLERFLELKRELQLARAANEMLRDSSIADVLRLAAESNISLKDLINTLRAIQSQGPKFTAERAGELAGELSRSQRELLIIYLLLKRLAELPTDSSVEIGGKKLPPKEAAKLLAKRLFKEIMGSDPGEMSLEKMFDKLLKNGKKLDERNIFRTFFKIVENAKFFSRVNAESSEPSGQKKLPLRDLCIELARNYEPDSSRIAFNSTGEDIWQLGGNFTVPTEPVSTSSVEDDDDDDDDEELNSSAGGTSANAAVQLGPISKHGFERSISGLGLYEENTLAYENVRGNLENYIQNLVDASGTAGYQEAALQAGLLGMNEEQSVAFGEILQEMVTDAGIRWLTLNIPSPITEPSPSSIATEVPAIEIETISSLPTPEDQSLSNPQSAPGGASPGSTPGQNPINVPSGTETMESNYTGGGTGGSELWVTVGTLVDEPIVGPTPPPPPPPPAPPPSSGGGGNQPSGGGGNQPTGGGSQPGGTTAEPGGTNPPPMSVNDIISGNNPGGGGSYGDDDDDSSSGGDSSGGDSGDSGGFGCFVGSTLVWTPLGYRPIATVSIGDFVFSYDVEKERIVLGRVTWCRSVVREEIVDVGVADETITCSDNHRFLTTDGKWQPIGKLDGKIVHHEGIVAAKVNKVTGKRRVYNFTTIPCHNYFVGRKRLIVHNIK